MVAFWVAPKPDPNSTMPATTAAGRSTRTRAPTPAAVVTTPGTSRAAGPWRSPYRPAHQRHRVEATAWTNRPSAARLARPPATARGRKVTTTPAAVAAAAKVAAGRRRAGVRSPVRIPTGGSSAGSRPGSPGTTTSPASAATAPATNTTG